MPGLFTLIRPLKKVRSTFFSECLIINMQKPLHEIWMAARAGGFHYKFDGQAWRDTKVASEFFADLSKYASQQAGRALTFSS